MLDRAAGWAWRLLAVGLAGGAALWLLGRVSVIVLPSVVALTLAPALTPLVARLRRSGLARPAPGIALVVAILGVASLIAVVAASVVAEWDELVRAVRRGVREAVALIEGTSVEEVPIPPGQEINRIEQWLDGILDNPTAFLVEGARTGAAVVTGIVLAVAVLYFVLRDGEELWDWVVRRFSPQFRPQLERAGQSAWENLGGFMRGTVLIASIDAILIGAGLAILGVPLAFPLAVLVFLGGFVPFVGATIAGAVAVLVAFADSGIQLALIAAGLIVGVQFIEGNFLQPIIQGRTVNLHPAVILLAVAAGGSIFGIFGAYLAVPVTAVVFAAVTELNRPRVIDGSEPVLLEPAGDLDSV